MTARRVRQLQGKRGSLEGILSEVRRAVSTVDVAAQRSIHGANVGVVVEAMRGLEARVESLETLANALHDDYEKVTRELQLQREVTLRLCSQSREGAPLVTSRQLEGEIRLQVISERGSDDGSAA